MSAASRRLFFALWPSAEQQSAMAASARELLDGSSVAGAHARVVPDANLHVTLAFLGSVPEARLSELAAIAHRVAASGAANPSLRILFDGIEYWKKAQVLCAVPSRLAPGASARNADAASAADAAAERDVASARDAVSLAAALKLDLVAAGFAPDLKPFRAHVTLARKVPRRSDWKLYLRPVSWRFSGFSLIESRTVASGALYSVVESWLLAKARLE